VNAFHFPPCTISTPFLLTQNNSRYRWRGEPMAWAVISPRRTLIGNNGRSSPTTGPRAGPAGWSRRSAKTCHRVYLARCASGVAPMTYVRSLTFGETQCPSPRQASRGASARSAAVVRTVPSMTRVAVVPFGSRSEGSRLRGASRYPMSAGSVLRSCLDPPQRSVRTSAADLRSNRPGTDYPVDPL